MSKKNPLLTITVTALMLFSMFFGAGNLIFPPMLGVEAGTSFTPAIVGFLGTGVLLPILAIVAIAISGNDMRDLASRGGVFFGVVFSVVAYLSIGAFYALPRTGAVSYETAFQPLTGWDSLAASAAFNFCFFGVALLLAWNPSAIVDNLGKFLTPVLLVLLLVLVVIALSKFDGIAGVPSEKYAEAPLAAGLLEGYLTMDSIASLAFGIIVISALKHNSFPNGSALVRGTILAGIGAGVILGIIYVALGYIGQIIPDPSRYVNGAGLLSDAANLAMGYPGQIVFGLIVLLACLSTAVGLIAATSEFFSSLMPRVTYKMWAVVFALMSFAMATMGLDTVLAIAAPIIGFIYPPAITLIFITLIEPLARPWVTFHWTFRLAIWVAVVWSALVTFDSLGWGSSIIVPLISWTPLHDVALGWVLPTLLAFVVGVGVDAVQRHRRRAVAAA
ncbi:Branched-chain amino acid transport system 2 carrier protein [Corynebacterium atrinae]|uniref:branched-chain amino acid transport system II carrier protein n=1 Tax=Corynebacterium atrinae TaxID=1336740 RepID=UPI0025B3F00C|nr:branched-chain amino acid transport system II carrier protein [Corynebacterium atrinae]WJY63955.1 Branched-chain amino acid transport system 2 carrier protein [Corynebacterium atrinae]